MRTAMRVAAVAAVATCALAGTMGAASAAPASSHWATMSAPHSVKAGTTFYVNGSGYDARTNSGVLCLEQRVLVHGHWGAWKWELCEAHRSGHHLSFRAVAKGGLPAGTYDLRLVLESNPKAGVWKPLDWSGQHVVNVHR